MANFVDGDANNARHNSWSTRVLRGSRETARHRRPRRHLLPRKNPQRLKDAADTKFYYLYLKFIIARAPEGPGPEQRDPSSFSLRPFADILSRRRPNLSFLNFLLISYPPAESRIVALRGSSRRSPKSASVHRRNVVPLIFRSTTASPPFLVPSIRNLQSSRRFHLSSSIPSFFTVPCRLRDLDAIGPQKKDIFPQTVVRTLRLRKKGCGVMEYRITTSEIGTRGLQERNQSNRLSLSYTTNINIDHSN